MIITNFIKKKGNPTIWEATVNGQVIQFIRYESVKSDESFRWFYFDESVKLGRKGIEDFYTNLKEVSWQLSIELEMQYDMILEAQIERNNEKMNIRQTKRYYLKKGMLTVALVALLFIIESLCMVQYENSPDGNQDYFGITRSNLVTNSAPKVGVENNHSYKYKENYVNHD